MSGQAAQRRPGPRPSAVGRFGGAGMPAEKPLAFRRGVARLLRRLRPEAARLVVVTAAGVVATVFAVLGPKLLGLGTTLVFAGAISRQLPAGATQEQVIAGLRASGQDQLADLLGGMRLTPGVGIDFLALSHLLMWVLALYCLSSLLMWVQAYVLNGVVMRTVYRLRRDVEAKIHRVPLSYVDGMQRGELLSRVTNDIDNVQQSLQQSLSQVLTSLLTVVGVLVMMFVISPVLAVIAVVTIPLTLLVTKLIASRSQRLFVAQWRHTGELNGHVEEAITGHLLVKVFGRQRESGEVFRAKNEELYAASFGAQFVSGVIMPAMTFVGNLVYVAIAVVGGVQVASGLLQIGDVQAFIQYSRQFTQPLSQLGSMANVLQSGVASAERVFELLDAPEEPETGSAEAGAPDAGAGEAAGRLAFEHVSFRYEPDAPLIEDLSLVAEPGRTIAIVGPTGAGKTTLVGLLMRFYDVDSGRITLDGVDTRSMSRQELRRRMGMVLQDTWLFSGTIRENIAYGHPGASGEDIVAAARATHVDHFVRSLPDGYDTVLEDEGTNLSAGERQLITIARAFLARPSVLILDEATSSVDTRTELLVQQAMSTLRAGRTSFVIAHRLSTIRDADLILVMEHGRIVERGSHRELLERDGAYRALYESQFAAAAVEGS